MNNYVGIDLGTTNSAICSFDGVTVRLYKSPEQNDITPSAIFIDKRGNKYVGARAYDSAARDPGSGAVKFKRLMGTKTPIKLSAVNITMTPEECSREILKVLYGYLPEEIRNNPDTGTVITVPAAFNQMQKDATMSASESAGLGRVALMQEPVAAVMSVMRQRKGDGVFLVYDLGGGTLDIAIAQSIAGRVSLLSHGGIAMCGGSDFDRISVDSVVKPWLVKNFALPEDFIVNPHYKSLVRMATWAAEKAKIALSSKEEAVIGLTETELGVKDQAGQEIYLDVVLRRSELDSLIASKVDESIQAARDALEKAGLSAHDIERVVFVGGPTQYKPLRDRISFELGIAGSTEVNPLTAVAEGAAVFAESIDWAAASRGRKSSRGALTADSKLDLSFIYIARTPASKATIAAKVGVGVFEGCAFQIDSPDSGWSSGKLSLKNNASVEVTLSKAGENHFRVWIFDAAGGPIAFQNAKLVITRTAATIDAIPCSSSISVEALDKSGGTSGPVYLVRNGDSLPKKGSERFVAAESLRAGAAGSLNFNIWEGEIESPIRDNLLIGTLHIRGSDFDDGEIAVGAKIVCDYEILDSGNVVLEVSVPSVGATFHSGRNFYSRQAGQIDFTNASRQVIAAAKDVRNRIESVATKVEDPKLAQALDKLDAASSISTTESDPETAKQAMDDVLEAKKIVGQVRMDHLKEIRQMDLAICVDYFQKHVREHARTTEASAFDNLVKTAQRAIDEGESDFELRLDELRTKNLQILWRQDWFVIDRFNWLVESAFLFPDPKQHAALVDAGRESMKSDDIKRLRQIVAELESLRIGPSTEVHVASVTNVVRGA